MDQLTCYRADRALVEGGKRRGGGLCVYINDAWCRDAVVVCKHCSPLVEFMIIKCRPFYLPREFTAILLVAVYIPPSSNNNNRSEALNDLYQHISEQQTAHPDAFLILAGDFNHADLRSVFPKIHQHIDFPTRGKNTLDFVYTTQRGAYSLDPWTPSLDPFQFAYRSNRSTDDAIATALHPALTHLDKTDTYVRLLFIDFSSAFNTIIPQQLIHKLVQLGLNTSLCNWLLDFLTGRPQAVRVGSNTSSTITLNTGAPQGCVLCPLLFTLLTHDCTPSHNSNLFIKFADDTTVVGLISNRDETNYRSEVSRLAGWCSDNNLSLNVEKTKEIVVDFRRVHTQHAPLTINGATVERVSSTKFLGVHITEDLSWTNNTAALAKKAQQRLYFLCKLRRARAPAPIMCTFYRGTIESILTSCITVWYGACNASCRKSLQRIVRAAEKIVGVSLPSLQDI